MAEDRLSGLMAGRKDGPAASIRPYSSLIRILRYALPLSALGLLMLLAVWPRLTSLEVAPVTADDLEALREAETENRLLDPVFATTDEAGRPVTITADEARQNKARDALIHLRNPQAALDGGAAGGQTALRADAGTFDQTRKLLHLRGGVVITDDARQLTLETESLNADLAQGAAESNSPATLTGPQGTITGQSVTIEQGGTKTIFQGPAKAVMK